MSDMNAHDYVQQTKAAVLSNLVELEHYDDPEAAHQDADDQLCRLLFALGFDDVVAAFRAVPKWYA